MRAIVSVLTAKLDLPVPSGLVPLGHVPKVRPYRRAGYESEILSFGFCRNGFSYFRWNAASSVIIPIWGTARGTHSKHSWGFPVVKDLIRYPYGTACGTVFVMVSSPCRHVLLIGDVWLRENEPDLCKSNCGFQMI
jgi:hypothetical protein